MKQLLILSGKGGTGKTTVASSFIKLSQTRVFADCDVDAPNLHILLNKDTAPNISPFYGLDKASIDNNICTNCNLCREKCRFDAVSYDESTSSYNIDPFSCEGCSLCEFLCPVNAIKMVPHISGYLKLYRDNNIFSTAELEIGSGNSGLLVTEVKKRMKSDEIKSNLEIIDGSPGIGCPVIASITGVDMVLIVTEPSISGVSDLNRIINTVSHFGTKMAVCINKYDVNIKISKQIQEICKDLDIPYIGSIPYDESVITAVNSGKTIVDIQCEAAKKMEKIYSETIKLLF
jgi:MinD superfamily P-loop ATPase